MRMAVIIHLILGASALLAVENPEIVIAPRPVENAAHPLNIGPSAHIAARSERQEKLALLRDAEEGGAQARSAWNKLGAAERTSLLAEFVTGPQENVARTRAVKELARMSASDDVNAAGSLALAKIAVLDKNTALRNIAREGLSARQDDRVADPIAGALWNDNTAVQRNAAEALVAMGGPRVIEVTVEHWKEIWGASNRSHVMFGTMRSYIANYSISGDAYQPEVRSFLTGTILDAKVLKVERDIYIVTLREIAGPAVNLPNDPGAWEQWLKGARSRLAREAMEKQKKSAAALAEVVDE